MLTGRCFTRSFLLSKGALRGLPGSPTALHSPAPRHARGQSLTPSEAKLASVIGRGAPPYVAARELKISRETARNQLKAVFAKTDTHRQSELVVLLMQVG
jgi:DNA-binding CsgD family transcriptional regulator